MSVGKLYNVHFTVTYSTDQEETRSTYSESKNVDQDSSNFSATGKLHFIVTHLPLTSIDVPNCQAIRSKIFENWIILFFLTTLYDNVERVTRK